VETEEVVEIGERVAAATAEEEAVMLGVLPILEVEEDGMTMVAVVQVVMVGRATIRVAEAEGLPTWLGNLRNTHCLDDMDSCASEKESSTG